MCDISEAYDFLIARGKSKDALDEVLQSDTPEKLIWWMGEAIGEEIEAEELERFEEQQLADAGY